MYTRARSALPASMLVLTAWRGTFDLYPKS